MIFKRAKNFVKLAQGEFVAVEHLESVYSSIPLVSQICVHADPLQSFLIAIVVPNASVMKSDEVSPEKLETTLLSLLAACSVKHKLQTYECPRGVLISPVEFTADNGMLTGSIKPNRKAIADRFAAELQDKFQLLQNFNL